MLRAMGVGHFAVGLAVLLFGRRLFWVFVAGAGFAAGSVLALEYLRDMPGWVPLVVALVAGVLAAVLAVAAQKAAIAVAGFLGGGYLGYLAAAAGMAGSAGIPGWAAFLGAGVIGAILLVVLFDWALIGLSSLVGAALTSQAFPLVPPWPTVLFVVLLCAGVAIQTRQRRARARRSESKAD